MTNIYRLKIKIALVLLICSNTFASDLETSFCFEYNHLASKVKKEFDFLFIPKDSVEINDKDNCIQVRTSDHRVKLLEKAIQAKYNLLRPKESRELPSLEKTNCNLNYIISQERDVVPTSIPQGNDGVKKVIDVSTSEFIIGLYDNVQMNYEGKELFLECTEIKALTYDLTLFVDQKNKEKYKTSFQLNASERVDLAPFIEILNKQLLLGNEKILLTDKTQNKKYEIRMRGKE